MSFFKGLIKKGKDEEDERNQKTKEALEKELAQQAKKKAAPAQESDVLPSAEAAMKARRKLPTQDQKSFFDAQRANREKQIGSILVKHGLLSDDMVKQFESEAAGALVKNYVEHGLVREDDVLEALATELGMDRVELNQVEVTPEMLVEVPKKIAREYRVFPVSSTPEEICIAISDPLNIQVMDDLQRILGKPVRTLIAREEDIDRFFKRFYEGDEIKNIYADITDKMHQKEMDDTMESEIEIGEDEDAPPVVKFVDLIFKQAVHERASDIHIEPNRQGVGIRFRIDGVLQEMPQPPKKWQNAIISRLKVLSGMDLAEKRVPQDGRIKLSLPDRKLDLRVSALPSIYGETIVMRILDQSSVLLGLEDVGFLPDNIRLFNELIRRPTGVILMTGPTGSGKTTTLYSALSTINTPEVKIVTIENPVEYMLDGVNQVQVNEDIGFDFALGLRSILRQSPDVLLVGEMRDLETAEIGIRAALTGHLVFSTLHTNDAPSAPSRLVDMGVKPFLVASSLQAVVAQRLIRRLCASCKAEYTPTPQQLAEIGASEEEMSNLGNFDIYKNVGCDRCTGSGFRGRTAIHEIMVVESRIRQLVIKGESAFRLKKIASRYGMRTLRMDGWEKVKLGQTTITEVMRITQSD